MDRLLRNDIAGEPALDIASRIFRTRKVQRFAADQRHGFGFDLFQIAFDGTVIAKLSPFSTVPEADMRHFVEESLVRHRTQGADRDLAPARITQRVSIELSEGDFTNIKNGQGAAAIPCRRRRKLDRLPIRLAEKEPKWSFDEAGDDGFLLAKLVLEGAYERPA